MRVINYDGVEHRLSERNWKQALRRYDTDNAKPNNFGYYCIYVNNICVGRAYKCIRCPMRDPHKKVNSCTYWFRDLIGEDLFPHLHLFDNVVMWDPEFNSEARQALQKLRGVLATAKKV